MSRPLRLLMTADAVGGVWTYALDLARGLADAGVQTVLVALGPAPSPAQADAAQAIPGLELIETGLPLDWTAAEPAEVLETAAAVRGLARGARADLIHLNTPALAALPDGFPAPVVGACHSCLATWWAAVREGPMPSDFAWRTRLLWQGLHACDLLIAPTRAFARATARAYDVAPPRVVWNGRPPAAPPDRRPAERLVFTAGRLWDEGKNLRVLDAAAERMQAPLYAAGPLEGPNGARVTLGAVRTLGLLSPAGVADWLQRSSMFASSALYEPFGLGVLEAAQAGCALVLSDIPTFRELWDGAAEFVAPDDAEGFARACDRLAADDRAQADLAGRARARAARYSAAAMTAGVLDAYRPLVPGLVTRRAA
jgi:glycosyltransferase involved in cell wall biosynthesis